MTWASTSKVLAPSSAARIDSTSATSPRTVTLRPRGCARTWAPMVPMTRMVILAPLDLVDERRCRARGVLSGELRDLGLRRLNGPLARLVAHRHAFGAHEGDVSDAEEAEEGLQVGFLVIEGSEVRA